MLLIDFLKMGMAIIRALIEVLEDMRRRKKYSHPELINRRIKFSK